MVNQKKLMSIASIFIYSEERRRCQMKIEIIRRNQSARRRRTLLLLKYYGILMEYMLSELERPIRLWSKPRFSSWWEESVLKTFTESDWIKNFRMNKITFMEVCNLVREDLQPKLALLQGREPLSVEKQVAIAIYNLASCAEMRVIANNMGVGISTVHKCLRRFVESMMKQISSIINIPDSEEAADISNKFFKMCKIPQILLIIDGTHIPIIAPAQGYGDFKNRKGWTSYNVQVVVDANYLFRDISCQFPGGCHDAYVFKNSGFFQHAEAILPKSPKNIEGPDIDYLVRGDPAYPMLKWLLKGYSGKLTLQEESCNVYINSARIVVEQAIGKLKSRWRILRKNIEMDYTFVPKIVATCCMLHNIVQRRNVPAPAEDISENLEHNITVHEQPNMSVITLPDVANSRREGEKTREALKNITDRLPLREQIRIKRK